MNDIDTAVFVGLSLSTIPPASWDLQIFVDHKSHAGTVTTHSGSLDGNLAKVVFEFTDSADKSNHSITGTMNWTNGATTFSLDATAEPVPTGYPQIDAGIQPQGSQVWFRYIDASNTLREYRFHTKTNPNILQAALKDVNAVGPLAATIVKWLGVL